MAGYTRQEAANIVTANAIEASQINNELNAIDAAFHATTGHQHDGTTGDAPKVVLTTSVSGTLPIANGGTAATTAAAARTALGVAIGSDVQAYDSGLTDILALTPTDSNFIVGNGSTWVAETGATVRTSLGVPSTAEALLVANNLSDIGTAATARTNLGLAIGTDVQAYHDKLADISGLSPSSGEFIKWDGANFIASTSGIGTGDLLAANNLSDVAAAATARTNLGLAIGTDVQAYDAQLADIAALAVTDSNFIVGNGSTWVAESGATARTSLGVPGLPDDNSWTGAHDWSVPSSETGLTVDLTGTTSPTGVKLTYSGSATEMQPIRIEHTTGAAYSQGNGQEGAITITSDEAGANWLGSSTAGITCHWDGASPADSDTFQILRVTEGAGAAHHVYGRIDYLMSDVTNATEDGYWRFASTVAGTIDTDAMKIGAGVTLGAPTGGFQGAGTLNALGVYDDSVLLTDFVADAYNGELDESRLKFYDSIWHGNTNNPARDFSDRAQESLDMKTFTDTFVETGSLPAMPTREEWLQNKYSVGELVNSLWETVEVLTLHIKTLNERTA